jgi:hypothetical protein
MNALLGADVDIVLQHARIHHTYAYEHKTSEDAADGIEVNLEFAQSRIDDKIQEGDENDQSDGVEVL